MKRLTSIAGVVAAVAATTLSGMSFVAKPLSADLAVAAPSAGFVGLTPTRILDTREGIGAVEAPVGPGNSIDLIVGGRGGVPLVGVAAVVLNVTVTGPDAPSYVTVWPTGSPRPTASNLNFVAGQTVPNLVIVKVGTSGMVSLYNFSGSTHLIADVSGYYTSTSQLTATVPTRLLDTRDGTGGIIGPTSGLVDVIVGGRAGVPNQASAVVMNVTVTEPATSGFLTVWPSGAGRPTASNLNFVAGQTVPNLVIAKIGLAGKVSYFSSGGPTHVIIDVLGYVDAHPTQPDFYPLVPNRILDTREGIGAPTGRVAGNTSIDLQVLGRGGVPSSGVGAIVMNLTVTEPELSGYLTVWPAGVDRPTASNVNFVAGQSVPNLVIVPVGIGGRVSIYNFGGRAHIIGDVLGWFPGSVSTTDTVNPFAVPDPPTLPRFTDYKDSQLTLQWDPPATVANYGAIVGYEVDLAGVGVLPVAGNATQLVATGLTNGIDYTFKVRARNSSATSGGWGGWSVSSAPDHPSRSPDPVAAVTAVPAGDAALARVAVTWPPPLFDGGRPITGYKVCQVQVPTNCQTDPNTRQATFAAATGADYSFTVIAFNTDKNKNDSVASTASNIVKGVVTPGVPTVISVLSGDRMILYNASTGSKGGCATTFLEYAIDGGPWQTSSLFSGLTNGVQRSLTARATLGADCIVPAGVGRSSAATTPIGQTPYGPLGQPTITSSVSGSTITWTWNANQGANGRAWVVTISGQCSASVGVGGSQTGSCSQNVGYNSGSRTSTITVSAPGVSSLSASSTNATGAAPPPPAQWTVTTNVNTCPEPNFSPPSNWNGGGCNGDRIGSYGFIPNGTALVVDRCENHSSWSPAYPFWYRIIAGGPGSGWVAQATVNGSGPPC